MATSTKSPAVSDKLPEFALLTRQIEQCGWKRTLPGPLEEGLFFQTGQGGVRPPTALFKSERGEALLAVDFGDLALAGREELFPRFLDFSMETRLALGAARAIVSASYLILMSAGRIELFRLPEETLEYAVASLRSYEDELLPSLTAKARAKGESVRASHGPLEQAQALRGWIQHWSRNLASKLGVPLDDCEKFIWKFVLMLQTVRKTGKSEILGGWGLTCEKLGPTWSLAYDSLNTHADLARALDEFDTLFSTRIFSGDAETHKQWLQKLEETSFAEQLRAEMLMQSQSKFEAETVAWLFTQMEREEEGWRREIAGPLPVRRHIHHQGWMVVKPMICDVAGHGLCAALQDAERLAQYWSDYDAHLRRGRTEGSADPVAQPDLFFGAPRGVNSQNQLDDGFNFLFADSLRLAGVGPEEQFGVGLTFLLKALALAQQFDWPFRGVDTLDCLWKGGERS